MGASGMIGTAMTLALTSAAPAIAKTMVYVSNADSGEISVLQLDAQAGALVPVETVPVSGTAMPMAISPDRRHLYVSLRSQPFSVSSFAIDQQTGKLDLLSTVPLPDNMAYVATDRSGRFLIAAGQKSNSATLHAIDGESGALKELKRYPLGKNPNWVEIVELP